jgi:hypothetical protein
VNTLSAAGGAFLQIFDPSTITLNPGDVVTSVGVITSPAQNHGDIEVTGLPLRLRRAYRGFTPTMRLTPSVAAPPACSNVGCNRKSSPMFGSSVKVCTPCPVESVSTVDGPYRA